MSELCFREHDHANCVEDAMAKAEAHCDAECLKLTPIRKSVLEYLHSEHRAFGAYEVLEMLREQGLARHPPMAYRALDFWVDQGFAHKIERLNAFLACSHPKGHHHPAFLFCRQCLRISEIQLAKEKAALERVAEEQGFMIEREILEIEGLCRNCRGAENAAHRA